MERLLMYYLSNFLSPFTIKRQEKQLMLRMRGNENTQRDKIWLNLCLSTVLPSVVTNGE